MTIKKLSILILITFFIVISLSACLGELHSNSAKIVISFGGANRAVYKHNDSATHEKLEHKIVLTSETETLNFTAAGGTFEANVAPGNWNIEVVSYLDGDVYAAGEKDVTLIPGLNNETIAMYEAHLVKFISNGGSAVEEQVIYHAQKIKSDNISTSHPSLEFVGWYDLMEELFDYKNKLIIESITLHAKWKEKYVDGDSLINKLNWIIEKGVNGGNYIVEVEASDVIEPFNYSLPLPTNTLVSITLISDNPPEMRTIKRSGIGSLFTVNSGVTLTLGSYITLEGNNNNDTSLIMINSGGVLETKPLSKITGNTNTNTIGEFIAAGVHINENAKFIMNGGEISFNTTKKGCGGVKVHGTFTINNGKISENKALGNSGGGVWVEGNGRFIMNGGEISGNQASGNISIGGEGGGVHMSGKDGIFIMNGGIISGNIANGSGGGVRVDGTFTMKGNAVISGNISENDGGGVKVYKNFTMEGGIISDNISKNGGGGVRIEKEGIFTMEDGEISGNITEKGSGGGVCVNGGTFEMYDGKISGNKAAGSNLYDWYVGGGVYVSQGLFNMTGGMIYNNTADRRGGGVHVENNSTFTMGPGIIEGNYITIPSSDSFGGGVCVHDSTFTMNSGKIISNKANSNIGSGGGGVNLNKSTFTMNGGEISNNTTSGKGGGVCMTYNVTFTKSGGTIYGKHDLKNANTASENNGSAVFVESINYATLYSKENNVDYPLSYTYKGQNNGTITGNWDN